MNATQARGYFALNLPAFETIARAHFRGLRADARAEALQNATSLAWKYWEQLTRERPGADPGLIRSVWWHAIRHHKAGRSITRTQTDRPAPGGDTMDLAPREACPIEHAARNESIPDTVALRIDFPAFLATLGARDRGMTIDLAAGMGNAHVAVRHGVQTSTVAKFRTRCETLYHDFYRQPA